MCDNAGFNQSPIDAMFAEPVPYPTPQAITLAVSPTACAEAEFVVNAHTVEVMFPAACVATYTATFLAKTYNLLQFHYHAPSEHTQDGKYYPMEVHHVHKAADGSDGVMVIGVFMTVDAALDACPNPPVTDACKRAAFFDKVLTLGKADFATAFNDQKGKAPLAAVAVPAATVANDAYNGFIPPMTNFFHYMGSFTTPPCTAPASGPGVVWIINPTAVGIKTQSLKDYRTMINSVTGTQVEGYNNGGASPNFITPLAAGVWDLTQGNNNRKIQPLGTVRKFYSVSPVTVTTTVTITPWDSSASSSGTLNSLGSGMSSSSSLERDSSGSYESSGSAASGSSGFYMALWKWFVFIALLCCCLAALAGMLAKPKPKKKKVAKKPTPTPAPKPAPVVEAEPLLLPAMPPLMPTMPVQTTSFPQTTSYAMPVAGGYPMAPGYGPYGGYPGQVV